MSRSTSTLHLPPRFAVTRAFRVIHAFLASVWAESLLRRDRRLLELMDDRSLGDIGVPRGGIEDAVRHGRSRLGAAEAEWSLWHAGSRG